MTKPDNAKRRYNVHLYENTLWVREFEATSEEDAIAQAMVLYEQRLTGPFEDFGSEIAKCEAEPVED